MVDATEIAQAVLRATDGLFPESDEVSSAELSPANLPAILVLLQETINGIKSEIRHVGESNQEDVVAWTNEARKLHKELAQDHESLDDIAKFELNGTKLDDRVRDLSSQQALLTKEIAFNEDLVALLCDLKGLQDAVSEARTHAVQGSLNEACERFEDASHGLDKLSEFDHVLAVGLMKENVRALRESLVQQVEEGWATLITSNIEDSSLTILQSVPIGSGSASGADLIKALERLGILRERLDRLHYRVTHVLLFPRLDTSSGAGYQFSIDAGHTTIKLERRSNHNQTSSALYSDLKVIFDFLSEKLGSSIAQLLSGILTPAVLNLLMGSYLPLCIPTNLDLFSDFETVLTETTDFEKYLDKAGWLGRTKGELKDWVSRTPRIWLNRRRESALDSLRKTFSRGLGQRHRAERVERAQEVDGVLEGVSKPIDEAEDHWDTNWDVDINEDEPVKAQPTSQPTSEQPKKVSQPSIDEDEDISGWGFDDDINIDDEADTGDPVAQADSLQAGQNEDTEATEDGMEWGWGDEDDTKKKDPPQQTNGKPGEKEVKDITLTETYSITSIPQEVVDIILRTIDEATKLSQPEYSNLTIASSISGLLGIPASVLTAYRALSGIFYRDDPSPAICIYNDCEWLEEHLLELEKDIKSRSGPFAGFDLQPSIQAISLFGRRTYWREMDSKRIILSDLMDGAQGFENCTQYPMSLNCETAIDSIIQAIQGIEMQWRDTLSRSALLQSLGSLLNTVVTKFINDVEDLGDISADASVSLASYVSEIGKLEQLFLLPGQPEDALPMTPVYCEKWLKFQYLGNILDSTMVEIMDLWREGALVDFEKDELIDLVKAFETPPFERQQTVYKTDPQFQLDSHSYQTQYVDIYFLRLAQLKPIVEAAGRQKWEGMEIAGELVRRVDRVLDVRQGELCWVAGTVYMEMPLKPNVLEDISKDHFLAAPPSRQKYRDFQKDEIMLEDESGRIRLIGNTINREMLVTGCVIAVMGTETAGGEFEVGDIILPELPPQSPRPPPASMPPGKKRYVGLVSGLNITGNVHESIETHLLTEYLLGETGGPEDRAQSSSISRLIIAGNSLADSQAHAVDEAAGSSSAAGAAGARPKHKKYGYDAAAYNPKPTTTLDSLMADLCTSISVTLMPGESDPANTSLPQQKMHPTMFPAAKYYTGSTFIPTTNPSACEIDGVRFLGTSGQTIDDIFKYVDSNDRLGMMERTLRWRHVAPTAPDTLWCFPFQDVDKFIVEDCPHVYFVGNQPEFGTRLAYGPKDQVVRLVALPKFSETGELVLLDLDTLECELVSFKSRSAATA
ncbi:hypothetical protein DRE_04454 [Drechslerella stenobrocha 248]|uniref:DNA-directed DNA polymerase n=1 Tax=Drechslerella stenobrocha 248 TaxID=1043628 RepID=W7I1Z4_9PEZI|nr:hypothetical protein DRE_04454 [Drechslerella stenobrocha 248]